MGFPWGHRDESGRRVGLSRNNYNASVQYADSSHRERHMQVSWDGSVVYIRGDTACLVC